MPRPHKRGVTGYEGGNEGVTDTTREANCRLAGMWHGAASSAFDPVLRRVRAGCALLFRAPWAAVRRRRSGRAAGVARDGNAFSRGQESARKARHRLTDFPSMDGRKAPTGVAFSFGYFSLGHAREK